MIPLIRVLQKVLVASFYERNAGLFLFIFYLMFGIVESSQLVSYHLSLMTGIVSSSIFLMIVCCVWILYMLKCIQFIMSRLSLPENEFLFRLGLEDSITQFQVFAFTVIMVDLPVLFYSAILISISIQQRAFDVAGIVIGFHCAIIILVTLLVRKRINSPHIFRKSFPWPTLRWSHPRPFSFFYIGQLTDQMKTITWVTKGFSILALVGFFQIREEYDIRVPLLGLLFGLAAHSVIVFEFRRFEDQYLGFTRNLPISLFRRFGTIAIIYLIMLAPEFVLLIVNHVHLIDAIGALLFGAGFLLFNHCLLYDKKPNMDQHTLRLLMIFLVSFMLVLFKLYVVELLVLWGWSFLLYRKNFYAFEAANG